MTVVFCDPKKYLAGALILSGIANETTVKLLNILLDYGVDVNSKVSHGFPLLHAATLLDNLDVIKCLISRGANLNLRFSRNLYVATQKMNVDIMRTLLEAGADVNIRDGNGRTALQILCTSIDGPIKKALNYCEILLQHGSRLDIPNSTTSTPLVNAFDNHTRPALAIYIIFEGGDAAYLRDPSLIPTQFFR